MLMVKQLSARGCLFLFVRTHHHLGYYFKVNDTRCAANQPGVHSSPPRLATVLQIRPLSQPAVSQRQ
jgi:hypothetical protein